MASKEENLAKPTWWNTFKGIFRGTERKDVLSVGMITEQSRGEIDKALEPKFLFKPPFGYPRNVNLLEIRRLAATPYVDLVISTIIDTVASTDWDIVIEEDYDDEALKDKRDHVYEFFQNPNTNNESFESIIRRVTRDILELDSGVIVKQFNMMENLVGFVAKDGATFTKNPDIYGMYTDREELLIGRELVGNNKQEENMNPFMMRYAEARSQAAYFQYGWVTGVKPIPFGKRELIWFERDTRTDDFYGRSKILVLADIIQMLLYGIDSNLKYYTENNIPRGVLGLEGSGESDVKAFEELFNTRMRETDGYGNWKRRPHHVPITNKKPIYTRFEYSNAEFQMLEQQQWFSKLVWSLYGANPSEIGFTEDAKGMANQIVQSSSFRKRSINPILRILEFGLNKGIVSEFGEDYKGIAFKFNMFDVDEESRKANLYKTQLETFRTVNEIRRDEGLEELEGGDELRSIPSANTFNFGRGFNQYENGDSENMRKREGIENEGRPAQEKSIEGKPFAGYRNFQDCVNKNKNKGDPEAYCATIMRNVEGKKALSTVGMPNLFPKNGEELDLLIRRALRDNEKQILALLEKETGKDQLGNIKAVSDVVDYLKSLLTFEGIKEMSDAVVRGMFEKGWDKSERQLNRNIDMNKEALEVLKKHTFDNIKGMTEEIANDLKAELERGFINAEGLTDLKERVKKVFDVGENRATMIARTETNRAENQGQILAMKQSGEKMYKVWVATEDDRTSALCKALDGQKVELNEKFRYRGQEFDAPPAHVDCRSTLIFEFDETEMKNKIGSELMKLRSSELDEEIEIAQKTKQLNLIKKKESLLKKLEEDLDAGD